MCFLLSRWVIPRSVALDVLNFGRGIRGAMVTVQAPYTWERSCMRDFFLGGESLLI